MTTLHRAAGKRITVELTSNGQRRSGEAEPRMLLCDFLRHELQAFGVHVGCEHGVCGACTVLVDGRAVRSCTQYAAQADGADIVTVEGLGRARHAQRGAARVCQASRLAMRVLHAGHIVLGDPFSARRHPAPDEQQVRDMLSGHICRCTGYAPIVAAMLEAAIDHPAKGR